RQRRALCGGSFLMWFTIALVYCATCWLLALLTVRLWMPQLAQRAVDLQVSPLGFQLSCVLLAPLATPIILYALAGLLLAGARRRAQLRHCLTTVREYEFAKVNCLYLAEPIRQLFDRHTPALFQLDFELLGDFRMKSQPVEVHDRIFLSEDGE